MDWTRRKIGVFYLTELIGQGGMSQVYLAVNPRTTEKRAVKILAKRATASATSYARFLREIEILRTLSHPNIVRILDSGALDDCYFYMMDLMNGSLAKRLARGRMPFDEAVRLFAVICGAVAHAHGKGIVHRDLKPANVLLADDGTPMVSDFGIAKALDSVQTSLTGSNDVIGTVAYLAPEQRFHSKLVDRRVDVYALGAIIYEMLMGFPPLGKFPWPRETQPGFPDSFQAILERCLAINPEDRYLHAGTLLSDLETFPGVQRAPGADSDAGEGAKPVKDQNCSGKSDRMEGWLRVLRLGTTKERLAVVRDMVEHMLPKEAAAVLKMFTGEEDRVRWGLIRVFGELKMRAATPLIVGELKNPYHRECAIEALGKIGAEEAFHPLRDFLARNPESATIALMPLALTGKQRSVRLLRPYLSHEMATVREAAIRALEAVETSDSFRLLEESFASERDDRVRGIFRQSLRKLDSALRAKEAILNGETQPSSGDATLPVR